MALRHIRVFGASEHNLKKIDVEIPRQALTVITGLSGSGKSSLAFDTIYAEGQRRYVESLSAYARQFLEQLPKPQVEAIEGLSPAISIEQKTVSKNPRSTVGTVTEIYDYLRLLFATVGTPHCPHCDRPLTRQTAADITRQVMSLPLDSRIMILAPVIRGRKGEYQALFQKSIKEGYIRAKVDGEVVELDEQMRLRKQNKHDISILIDRVIVRPDQEQRIVEAIQIALKKAERLVIVETVADRDGKFGNVPWKGERIFSEELGCPEHGPQVIDIAPRLFSFNSRYGWCETCEGIGAIPEVDETRVVPDPNLSLNRGAILPWKWFFERKNKREVEMMLKSSSHARQLFAVVDALEIDRTIPWNDLKPIQREVLLYGFRRGGSAMAAAKKKIPADVSLEGWKGVAGRIEERLDESDDYEYDRLSDYLRYSECPTCKGARLKKESLAVTLAGKNIAEICQNSLTKAKEFFASVNFTGKQETIAQQPLREIRDRLDFLLNVGLHYLTLDRGAGTLSGGEAQRIRLATQIGSRLTGVLYVLDEPSIGLHQRDNQKLIDSLLEMRDRGNTVIVVEHDEQTIRTADWVLDLGPGAGRLGGELIASGTPAKLMKSKTSLTAKYMSGELRIETPKERRKPLPTKLVLEGCTLHNLKDVTLEVPCGVLIGITGVSGSGKSSLIMETLMPLLMNHCYKGSHQVVGPVRKVTGIEYFDRCIPVDQAPIGRTPRSNPCTYTKIFDLIRDLFAATPDAKMRGYEKGRFSFNVKGGRCETCAGQGSVKVEMNFLPDVYITCETCGGKRYNPETLDVKYRERNIAEVLAMTVDEAVLHFSQVAMICDKLKTLQDVGLGYISLGQSALTLSGGEAQRIKLARELSKRNTGSSMYILDEPTTGLHFADVHKLLEVLNRLVATGSTVLVIEHHLDIIRCCDWLIDMGPDGGENGGLIMAQGPPEVIAACKKSETGKFLKGMLK